MIGPGLKRYLQHLKLLVLHSYRFLIQSSLILPHSLSSTLLRSLTCEAIHQVVVVSYSCNSFIYCEFLWFIVISLLLLFIHSMIFKVSCTLFVFLYLSCTKNFSSNVHINKTHTLTRYSIDIGWNWHWLRPNGHRMTLVTSLSVILLKGYISCYK